MTHLKSMLRLLKRFFQSKLAVALTLMAIIGFGATTSVHADSYTFSKVFQYYMLDNRANAIVNDAKNDKVVNIAPLGSGGVTGSLSYDDIVNSAPSSGGAQSAAKDFASMMATYSTFKYFSNKVQGFESIGAYIGRFLVMLIFVPISLVMDLINMLLSSLLGLIARLNIMIWFGSMLTNLSITSDLAKALNISKETFSGIVQAMMSIAVIFILIALWGTLRKGSKNIDHRQANKLKGRITSFLLIPAIFGISASLLQQIGDMTSKAPQLNMAFSRFLVDDRSWAYNYNFAPQGSGSSASDISAGTNGSYVDLQFDPYTQAGADRIADINKDSSIIGDGKMFPNTALLLAYGTSQSFSATDYINYKGSPQSATLLNGKGGQTNGSYYGYAQQMGKKLIDVDHAYIGAGGGPLGTKDGQEGSYKAAIDDYKTDKNELNTSPSTAWRDRFIYGAKNAGSLDKYYGEAPSQEMIQNGTGATDTQTVPSDQSMFLILSTIFDETGGRYYISAPARGIKQAQGQFDSNRSDYYVISMVGNWFFTLIGMLTTPLITLIISMALLVSLMSVGIIDMNVRPFIAWFKGMTVGDFEYAEATLVYAGGIAGTSIAFRVIPTILVGAMTAISALVVKGIPTAAKFTPSSPQVSLAYNGSPLIIQGAIAITFAILWLKSQKFRELLNQFFTFAWDWARATGDRLEFQANPNRSRVRAYAKQSVGKNKLLGAMNSTDNLAGNWAKNLLHGKTDMPTGDEGPNPDTTEEDRLTPDDTIPKSPEEIKRDGQFERIRGGLMDVQTGDDNSPEAIGSAADSEEALDKFKAKPNAENLASAEDRLRALRDQLINDGAPQEQIDRINEALDELAALGAGYNLNPDKIKTPDKKDAASGLSDDPVRAAQSILDGYSANPTPENLDSSRQRLEALRDNLIKNKAPQSAIDQVNRQLDALNQMARASANRAPRGRLMDAQGIVGSYTENPSEQSYQTAKKQLEDIRDNLMKNGGSSGDIAAINKQIADLNRMAGHPDDAVRPEDARKAHPLDPDQSAQHAFDTFGAHPSVKNYTDAKDELEHLRQGMIDGHAPASSVQGIDKLVDELNHQALNSKDPALIAAAKKAATDAPGAADIDDQTKSKQKVIRTPDEILENFQTNHSPEQYQESKSQLESVRQSMITREAPQSDIDAINQKLMKLDRIAQQSPTQPNAPRAAGDNITYVTNNHQIINESYTQELSKALGGAANNQQIADALSHLGTAQSKKDANDGLDALQQAIASLSQTDKDQINQNDLYNNLSEINRDMDNL